MTEEYDPTYIYMFCESKRTKLNVATGLNTELMVSEMLYGLVCRV